MPQCIHGNFAPSKVIDALPTCQAGTGRHKCPVCAYAAGVQIGSGQSSPSPGTAEQCAQAHGSAPIVVLAGLPPSQAGPQRHKCCYSAYEQGVEQGKAYRSLVEQQQADLDQIASDQGIDGNTRLQLSLARVGQGVFKTRVHKIMTACPLTGISDIRFLRASHIKPWSQSTNAERLDGYNGLTLAHHADHLFDGGWLTFADDGYVNISPQIPNDVWTRYRLETPKASLHDRHLPYLSFHRQFVFKE